MPQFPRCANAPVTGHSSLDAVARCSICAPKARQMMGLPTLSPQSMARVSNTSSYVILEDENASPEDLRALYESMVSSNSSSDMGELARHKNTPGDILAEIVYEARDERFRKDALANPGLPTEVAVEVFEDATEEGYIRVAALLRDDVMNSERLKAAIDDASLGLGAVSDLGYADIGEDNARALFEKAREDFGLGYAARVVQNLFVNQSLDEGLRQSFAREFVEDRIMTAQRGVGTPSGWMSDVANGRLAKMLETVDGDVLTKKLSRLSNDHVRSIIPSILEFEKIPEPLFYLMEQSKPSAPAVWARPDFPERLVRDEYDKYKQPDAYPRESVIMQVAMAHNCPKDILVEVVNHHGFETLDSDTAAVVITHPNLPGPQFARGLAVHGNKKEVANRVMLNKLGDRPYAERVAKRWKKASPDVAAQAVKSGLLSNESIDEIARGDYKAASSAARDAIHGRIAENFGVDKNNFEALNYIYEHGWYGPESDEAVFSAKVMYPNPEG